MKSLLLLSLLLATPALARIGETREQCDARYGKPVEENKELNATLHEKSGLKVVCAFHENSCEYIYFRHIEKTADGKELPLTESEKKILMESSSEGKPWTYKGKDSNGTYEVWSCGELEAKYIEGTYCNLEITTKPYRDRIKAKEAAKEKDNSKLKDF